MVWKYIGGKKKTVPIKLLKRLVKDCIEVDAQGWMWCKVCSSPPAVREERYIRHTKECSVGNLQHWLGQQTGPVADTTIEPSAYGLAVGMGLLKDEDDDENSMGSEEKQ